MRRKCFKIFMSMIVLSMLFQRLSAQDDILFRRYIINSGINGFFYGLAIDYITDAQSGAAAGLPIIAAGTGVIIPLLVNNTKTISSSSLILSAHGRFVGWGHGFALATLIGGENAWNTPNDKYSVALGGISSITLGIVGKSLGRTNDITEGQASMYSLYGWTMPVTGTLLMASISDSPRVIAAGDLIFAAGGYFLGDAAYRKYQYTRGDARAIQVFSLLNGGLGLGILADIEERSSPTSRFDLLLPAIGVVAGTLAGQRWVKGIQMTTRQGLNTAYATTGAAVFGLGISLITGSDNVTPYYTIPYITGLVGYAIMVESIRSKNAAATSLNDDHKGKWDFALMPQNILVNSKIAEHGYMINGRLTGMQPLFSASLRF